MKESSNCRIVALISHASKVMLKILQVRLQQDMNRDPGDVQAGFRKGRGTRDQIANIHWIMEKAREFQKKSTASLTALKLLTVWITTSYGKSLKRWAYPCLLRNLYACQEAIVRTLHGTTDLCKIGKGVQQGCILSPFYIMQNAKLDESQTGIKIARRNINFRYADDATLMAESKGELKNLLMRVKEESEKAGLKLNVKKTKIMVSDHITS